MKIRRKRVLAMLGAVAPALASKRYSILETLHVWFDGNHLSAYNEPLGIKIPFETDFAGGVPGKPLLALLRSSTSRYVTLIANRDNLVITTSNSRTVLPLRPITDWPVDLTAPHVEVPFVLTQDFIEGLRLTLLSVKNGYAAPAEVGITVMPNGGSVDLFSTDEKTVSWMKVRVNSTPLPLGQDRVILAKVFCEQIVKTMQNGSHLVVTETGAFAFGELNLDDESIDILVFSDLVEDDDPPDFEKAVSRFAYAAEFAFPIPGKLKQVLKLASAIAPAEFPVDIQLTHENDGSFLAVFAMTDATDAKRDGLQHMLPLRDVEDHPEMAAKVDIMYLNRALDNCQKMAITFDSLVFTGPKGFCHFIATRS